MLSMPNKPIVILFFTFRVFFLNSRQKNTLQGFVDASFSNSAALSAVRTDRLTWKSEATSIIIYVIPSLTSVQVADAV